MRDFTVYDLFVRNAAITPTAPAISAGTHHLSFHDLHERCEQLAGQLASNGIQQGDRIAILAFNHPAFFILYGAVAKIGAILVPLNWRLASGELGYILKDCQPSLLYTDSHQLATARQIAEPLQIPVVQLDQILTGTSNTSPPPLTQSEVKGETPLCIIYTAAVEGVPRGAVLSHTNLLSANLQVIVSMGLTANDAYLAMLPLFHITGMNLALAVLQQGGRNVIMEKFDEKEALRLSLSEHITLWGSFPPILSRMADEITKSNLKPLSLKYVVGLDGPEPIQSFEKLTTARFWILYGQSETSGFVTFSPATDRPGTAGKQGPLSIFQLVDEDDNPVPAGATGEITVRGPLVFQGYWRQETLNARTFRNDWHHTGDLGMVDEQGYLVFKGRKPEKELIKPGGENVYPAEVEAVILQHPDIEAVSVIGVPDPKFGEGVKAVCVLRSEAKVTADELIEFVGSRIARYKKPGYVEFVESLPKRDGKIDRETVKKLYG